MEILNRIISWVIANTTDAAELMVSAISLLVAIIALIKSSKAEKLQNKVNALELKIKEYELERITEEKESANLTCVEARAVKIGKGQYRLKVWNSGNATAYGVSARFDGDPKIILMDQDKQPFDELDAQKNYELIMIVHSGSEAKFRVVTEWEDGNGQHHSKSQMCSI
jgi:hypothetical protein